MTALSKLVKVLVLSALILAAAGANAATYVYVSNAEDGNIGVYTMENDGTLRPGDRVEAGKVVMPMSVSPDKRYLYATVRTKPYTVVTYAIDRKTGALKQLSKAPLADSFPSICVDKTGRYLLGASYGGHKVSVNAIGKNGKVSDPRQVIPTALNAHCIIIDKTNRYVPAPHPGTDQILPVPLRREDRQVDGEHAADRPDAGREPPAPHHSLRRQQVRVPVERADGHGDHLVARPENGPAYHGERGLGAVAGQQAPERGAAGSPRPAG